ncbi:amino acid adenylation domain-containing protein [Sciscionella marina]|uniref:amino acid adenylation domain-containing protein n=1 Tax=Sciscionella marina TaxID=508770 RepID=UPI00037B6C2D|nr:amino acid adenylation domain-containing protein [Sciscionella marina]
MNRLDELLAEAARRAPEAPALRADGAGVGYRELELQVRELADRLAAGGVRPGHRVGIHLPKNADAVRAVYAVLRAGAVAAPLEYADPAARIERAAQNADLDFVLTTGNDGMLLANVVLEPRSPVERDPGQDAYILFTSGSTGWPKGVLLTHDNILTFVRWSVAALGIGAGDRIGSQSALSFDLSTFDIFGSALAGACLVLLPEELKPFPRDVTGWLADERITVWYAVPTFYRALADRGGARAAVLPELRVCAFAGEPFPPELLEWYLREFPGRDWWNLYGPTETNVCTGFRVPTDWRAVEGLPIGGAIDGLSVELFDERDRPATEGEIAVAGRSVFRGYLQDGRLRDACVPLRFADGETRRAYRTGDLATVDGQGRIRLHGRRDHQVKFRGHRIDLGELEHAASGIPGIAEAVALPHGDRLALFAVTEGIGPGPLRAQLAAQLPRRMMPDILREIDRLPLNNRGKLDRPALAAGLPDTEEESND